MITNNSQSLEIIGSMSGAILGFTGGRAELVNATITLSSPSFSGAFVSFSSLSTLNTFGTTFSGTATGTRYSVSSNAVIASGGASFTGAGSSAGNSSSGGLFV